jgi:hypothetical protein
MIIKFPLSMVISLSRDISDHTPLLIDTGNTSSTNNQPMFKFELGWLLRDGFTDMVRDVWKSVGDKVDKMKCWQSKIRRLRQHLHGWAKHTCGINMVGKNILAESTKKRRNSCWIG